jgi:antitoxin MazE
MMQTTIVKWGNSQGIRLPKAILEEAHLKEDEKVEIVVDCGQLIIKKQDILSCNTLEELFAGFSGEYERLDIDWGNPVGN